MIGHRGLGSLSLRLSLRVSLCVLQAAVVATVSGLVGCTSGLDGRYHEIGDRPPLSAPVPSAQIARPLASATDDRIRNTGWRMGTVYVIGTPADELREHDAGPCLTAWGYQFEIMRGKYGEANTLFQIIPLVVGLERSVAIPSVNVLAAVRLANGVEFGGGPHYSPRMKYSEDPMFISGLGLAASVGYAFGAGELRIPVNFAVVFAGDSTTYSLTLGWTLPRE